MPAPHWFFRFMYDRESAAWERRRDEPGHRQLVKRVADELANVVAPPGPVADLGCGPGAHALALARRGYDVAGVDGSRRMVEVARTRAARDEVDATFDVHDVSAPLRFADASLGGVLAILVVQHLPHPAAFIAEIRRCLRPGGHLLITAPARDSTSLTSQNLYWRLRAACYQRRAWRRPLLRHELPPSSRRGPGPDHRRVQRRTRCRERAGSRVTSRRHARRKCSPTPGRGHTERRRTSVTTPRPNRQGCANNFRLCRGHLAALGQIQLTIMKFCIRIRYPASSCAGATRSFRQNRMPAGYAGRAQIASFGRRG